MVRLLPTLVVILVSITYCGSLYTHAEYLPIIVDFHESMGQSRQYNKDQALKDRQWNHGVFSALA